jgi:ATP-dependent Clp protease ATP-binding subunit ClpA
VDVVKKHPHSVILFDEIEKAHGYIFTVFLQIMGNAVITDENPP